MQRLLVVRSQPSGAVVYVNGDEAGVTPLEHPFFFYGTVDLELRSGGYRAAHLEKKLTIPWYQYFPLDFITEFLVPWPVRDVHTVDIELERYPEEVPEGQRSALTREERRSLEEKAAEMRRTLTAQNSPEEESLDGE